VRLIMTSAVLRTKSVEQSLRVTEEPGFRLERVLGTIDLGVLGIGVTIVSGIVVLRRTRPALTRAFRTPLVTWLQFVVWLAAGILVYASYGFWRSRLATNRD
jgi:hypothetical protein